jgi:hypothetical protein
MRVLTTSKGLFLQGVTGGAAAAAAAVVRKRAMSQPVCVLHMFMHTLNAVHPLWVRQRSCRQEGFQ